MRLKLRGGFVLLVVALVLSAVASSTAAASGPVIVNEEGEEVVHKQITGSEPEVIFETHEGEVIRCLDGSSTDAGEVTGLRSLKLTITYTGCSLPRSLGGESCENSGRPTGYIVANLVGKPVYLDEKHTEIGMAFEPEVKNAVFAKCGIIAKIGVHEAGKGGRDTLVTPGLTVHSACASPGQQKLRGYWEGESFIPGYLEASTLSSMWQEACIRFEWATGLHFEENVQLAAEAVKTTAKPRLKPVKGAGSFPVAFTSTGGKVVLESKELGVECKGNAGAGSFTNEKEAKLTLKWTECTFPKLGVKCTTSGAASGVIETKELAGALYHTYPEKITAEGKETGLVLSPASGEVVAEFKCSGLLLVMVKGSIIGVVSPLNKQTKTLALTLKRSGFVQVPSEYAARNTGAKVTAVPKCSYNGNKEFEACGIESASALAFTGEEVMLEA